MKPEEEKKNEHDLPQMDVDVDVDVSDEKQELPESFQAVQVQVQVQIQHEAADAGETKKGRKRSRFCREAELLTRDDYRIQNDAMEDSTEETKTPPSIQLYASDFDNKTIAEESKEGGRPKRQIKAVERYKDTRFTHKQQKELFRLRGKCGTGFLCPKCSTHLSYDLKQCCNCGVRCGYFPGQGVALLMDRSEVAKVDHGLIGNVQPILDLQQQKTKSPQKKVQQGKRITSPKRRKTSAIPLLQKLNGSRGKLSAQPYNYEVSGVDTFYVSKEKANEILSNSETVECEACMQVFLPSYLYRHRKRSHPHLTSNTFGCPYCWKKERFKSMEERDAHVLKMHPGQPLHFTEDEMNKKKLYIYACPKCDTAMAYSDLKVHLNQVHDEDFENVKHMITCTCPFCLQGPKPRRPTFLTADALLDHVNLCHPGCSISGKKWILRTELGVCPVVDDSSSKPLPKGRKKKSPGPRARVRKLMVEPPMQRKNKRIVSSPPQSNSKSSPPDFYWFALQPDILVKQAKISGMPHRKGEHIDSILTTVQDKIFQIQEREMNFPKLKGEKDDAEDYLAENRLYFRGIRERKNMAEGEALEKANFKDKCEERQRLFDYQNRGKKKSREELEFEELLTRPFRWQSSSRSKITRRGKCPFQDDCYLCNVSPHDKIETTNIIPSRGFRRIADCDLPDDFDTGEEKSQTDEASSSQRIRPRRNDKDNLRKLMELKHSLEFVKEFNQFS